MPTRSVILKFYFFPLLPLVVCLLWSKYPTDTHGKYWQELMNTAKTKENRFFFVFRLFLFSFLFLQHIRRHTSWLAALTSPRPSPSYYHRNTTRPPCSRRPQKTKITKHTHTRKAAEETGGYVRRARVKNCNRRPVGGCN